MSTPRATSTTGATDGYVQAPSLAQAVTAGLLRSGALRHSDANGPFRVKLTSRRVRKALKTLDGLRKGLTIGEVLGYHAERWLHDEHMDWLLYDLRTDYSVRRARRRERYHTLPPGRKAAAGAEARFGARARHSAVPRSGASWTSWWSSRCSVRSCRRRSRAPARAR